MKIIYTHGNIYTFDRAKPVIEAVVIENGRFIDMGLSSEMLQQWGRPGSKVINLEGKTVTPGLTDSHLHISSIANSFLNLDVTGVTSKQELLERIWEKANTLKEGEWLVGRGWDENIFAGDPIPKIEELDHVTPHCPLYISRICGHASLVNTKALEVSNYHSNIAVPEGGTIVLDKQTKKPTGLLLEAASKIVAQHIPKKSYNELKDAMRQAIRYTIQKGLTSVHTNDPKMLGGLDITYKIYNELLNEKDLGLRCNLLINHEFLDDLKESGMYTGYGNDTLQIGAVKIFADGVMGGRTALLSEPYSDAPSVFGDAIFDQEELHDIVWRARDLSMPVAVHAIGDKGLENILDILDQFATVAYRDRLIHTLVLNEGLIQRLVNPNRTVDIQPRFVAGDFPWAQERIGPERLKFGYAWKTLMSAGVLCAGGSDAPVEPVDPLLGIHAGVTRRKPNQTHVGYNVKEKLSMYDSFKLFTKMGAYPTNEEKIKGTITRGKLADMTVYSNNPFEMEDPDELLETDIEMTIIGGKVMHSKQGKRVNL